MALLGQFKLQPAAAPAAVRQTSTTDFAVDGSAYTAWSGPPTLSPSPDDPAALRLRTDAAHPLAYAAYALPAQGTDYNGLPRRVDIDIAAAPATPDAAPEPLEYYVAISNFSDTRWEWQGPFTTPYSVLLNAAGLRDRAFDLKGDTLVVVALTAGTGAGRAADLAQVRYSTAGTFYPVRPYRPQFSAANIYGSVEPAPDQPEAPAASANVALDKGSVNPDPNPFQTYGFDDLDIYRRPSGSRNWTLIGTAKADEALNGGALFADPFDDADGVQRPLPGSSFEYQCQLRNAQGSTAASTAIGVTLELAAPVFTQVQPDDQQIELAWKVQLDMSHYDLYRDNQLLATLPPDTGTYTDTTAVPGVAFTYRLRAVCATSHQDGAEASSMRWPYPAYRLSEAPGTGQMVDLSGHLMTIVSATAGANCAVEIKEATSNTPGPNDWADVSHSLPGQDPSALGYSWEGVSSTSYLADLYGQPLIGLDSDLSSSTHFDLAVPYRQAAPGELLANEWQLPWTDTYVTVPSLVLNYSVAVVHNAAAVAWLDENHVGVGYAAALNDAPIPDSDWQLSRATTNPATAVFVTNSGNAPALLVNEYGGMYYYRCDTPQPSFPSEWQRMLLDISGVGCSLTTVDGTPFVLYTRHGNLRFARSNYNNPSKVSDWTTGDITNGPVSLARATGINGVPAVAYVAHDGDNATQDGTVYLARAQKLEPQGAADWTLTPLDAVEDTDAPGIAVSADVLYVCYNVFDNGLRPSGLYLMSIPTQ